MGAVYLLTLRQLSGRWRLIILAILASLPVLITLMMLGDDDTLGITGYEITVLSVMLAGSIIPLVVLAIAGAAFSNELEDRTIANLTLAPLPRWKIVLPKLLGSISVAGPFVAVSAALTAHFAFLGDARATLAVTAASVAAVALYASAFTFLGLVTTQAIGIGLIYIVLWEGFMSGFVAGARILSIRSYAISLMHVIDPRRFADSAHLGTGLTLAIVLAVFAGFFWLGTRRLKNMDIP